MQNWICVVITYPRNIMLLIWTTTAGSFMNCHKITFWAYCSVTDASCWTDRRDEICQEKLCEKTETSRRRKEPIDQSQTQIKNIMTRKIEHSYTIIITAETGIHQWRVQWYLRLAVWYPSSVFLHTIKYCHVTWIFSSWFVLSVC